jgi:hypothetical protein
MDKDILRAMDLANQEADELIARMARRREQARATDSATDSGATDLIYKTFEPQPQADDGWQEWFARSFDDRMNRYLEIIGDETRQAIRKQADDVAARLDEIESRLDEIETRLDELDGGNGNTKRVVSLPMLTFKGGRNAA